MEACLNCNRAYRRLLLRGLLPAFGSAISLCARMINNTILSLTRSIIILQYRPPPPIVECDQIITNEHVMYIAFEYYVYSTVLEYVQ